MAYTTQYEGSYVFEVVRGLYALKLYIWRMCFVFNYVQPVVCRSKMIPGSKLY